MTQNIVTKMIGFITKLNLGICVTAICMLCLPLYSLFTPVSENMASTLTRVITSIDYHTYVYDLLSSHSTVILYIAAVLIVGIGELVICRLKKIPPTETEGFSLMYISDAVCIFMPMLGVTLLALHNAFVFFTAEELASIFQPLLVNILLQTILFAVLFIWPPIYGIIRGALQKKYREVEA